MKKLILFLIVCLVFVGMAVAQDAAPGNDQMKTVSWLISNWAELLIGFLAFVKIVVRLTPTLKDDAVFGKIDSLISWFIPNNGIKK